MRSGWVGTGPCWAFIQRLPFAVAEVADALVAVDDGSEVSALTIPEREAIIRALRGVLFARARLAAARRTRSKRRCGAGGSATPVSHSPRVTPWRYRPRPQDTRSSTLRFENHGLGTSPPSGVCAPIEPRSNPRSTRPPVSPLLSTRSRSLTPGSASDGRAPRPSPGRPRLAEPERLGGVGAGRGVLVGSWTSCNLTQLCPIPRHCPHLPLPMRVRSRRVVGGSPVGGARNQWRARLRPGSPANRSDVRGAAWTTSQRNCGKA